MALPIKSTPILTGKDAERFAERMKSVETASPTPEDAEVWRRAKDTFDMLSKYFPELI